MMLCVVASAGSCFTEWPDCAISTGYPGIVLPFLQLQSSCEDVHCADHVGVRFVAACDAGELRLCPAPAIVKPCH